MPTRGHQKPAEPRKPRQAPPEHGPNRSAVEAALPHLATGPHHAALVEAVRSLAEVVDSGFDDKAWREYRYALRALMEAGGGGSDELADEVDELRRASLEN